MERFNLSLIPQGFIVMRTQTPTNQQKKRLRYSHSYGEGRFFKLAADLKAVEFVIDKLLVRFKVYVNKVYFILQKHIFFIFLFGKTNQIYTFVNLIFKRSLRLRFLLIVSIGEVGEWLKPPVC